MAWQHAWALLLAGCLVAEYALAGPTGGGGKRGRGANPPAATVSEACESNVTPPQSVPAAATVENSATVDLSGLVATHSLMELVDFSNPNANLAWNHPSSVMGTAQVLAQVIKLFPTRSIKEPHYRVRQVPLYPIFSEMIPEAGGKGIVGQFDVVPAVVDYIMNIAEGGKGSHVAQLTGPAGTGKTEFLILLDRIYSLLSTHNPDFYLHTYRFKDLQKIPALKNLARFPDFRTLPSSPYVLLPEGMRRRLREFVAPRVNQLAGLDPKPFEARDPQTDYIVKKILEHKVRETQITHPTEELYVQWLSEFVDIVRLDLSNGGPPAVIRYQGANPKEHNLFFSEDPLMKVAFPNTPLVFTYNGEVLKAHRRLGLLDEWFRQNPELRNTGLEMAQNGVVASSGHAVYIETVWFLATNDESVKDAAEQGSTGAQLDRSRIIPQRQPLHPLLTAKTAVYTLETSNFRQARLADIGPNSDFRDHIKPLNLNEVFTNPDDDGKIVGPDGRYALFYQPNTQREPILIAPHSLEMMGFFAGATRMVRDMRKVISLMPEIGTLRDNEIYITNTRARMEAMLGETVRVSNTVLSELEHLRSAAQEGQVGITARTVEEWLKTAATAANTRPGRTITPYLVSEVFVRMSADPTVLKIPGDQSKAQWAGWMKEILYDMMLPRIRKDVLAILGATTGRIETTYDEIRREIDELQNNPNAIEWVTPGNERVEIQRVRLAEVKQVFFKVNGAQFNENELPSFHSRVTDGTRYQPLLRAISEYIFQKELSEALLTQYQDYFAGKAVSEDIRRKGDAARSVLASYGYNETAFREALAFVVRVSNQRTRDGMMAR